MTDSTPQVTSVLIKNVHEAIDEGDPALCIFLDLSKDFDTAHHTHLGEDGNQGNSFELFSNYLLNRKEIVQIRDKYSDEKEDV